MFLNKWTARVNYPGEIREDAFDSEEQLLNFINGLEAASAGEVHPVITVIDPSGEQRAVQAVTPASNPPTHR